MSLVTKIDYYLKIFFSVYPTFLFVIFVINFYINIFMKMYAIFVFFKRT